MNILVISKATFRKNGIAAVIQNLYANETFAQDRMTFVFPYAGDAQSFNILKCWGYEVISYKGRDKQPLKYLSFLKRLMNRKQIDMVHIHGNSSTCLIELIAARVAGVPVRIVHGHAASCKHMLVHTVFRPLVNFLATARFACSKDAGRFLFGKKDCIVIRNAFDLETYKENPALREKYRAEFGVAEKTVLGHVGLFSEPKNQTFLVDVLNSYKKKNNSAVLVLIGEGALQGPVREKAQRLGLEDSVIFLGSRNNVGELLNMFDYFLFPSLSEGFGIAPVEAQVNGLPTFAAKGRMPEAVRVNDNFRFVALEDGAEKWSDEILKMPSQRCAQALENARNAGFDIADEVDKLRRCYSDLLKG